jgi:hypothetical protein
LQQNQNEYEKSETKRKKKKNEKLTATAQHALRNMSAKASVAPGAVTSKFTIEPSIT